MPHLFSQCVALSVPKCLHSWRWLVATGVALAVADVPIVVGQLAEEAFIIDPQAGLGYYSQRHIAAADQNPPPEGSPFTSWGATNLFVFQQPENASLLYGELESGGGKLRVSGAGLVVTGLLDTAANGPFGDFIAAGDGRIGSADSGTLYFSFLFQLTGALTSGTRQNHVQLSDSQSSWANRITMGQTWAQDVFSLGGQSTGIAVNTETQLVVGRIDFQPGNDSIRAWWNPDLSRVESEQPPGYQNVSADRRFDAMRFISQGPPDGIFVDEIRFGTSWESVLLRAALAVDVSVDGEGAVVKTPEPVDGAYVAGESVELEAVPAAGWHFSHWSGTVSGHGNPIMLEVLTPHNIKAHFTSVPMRVFSTEEDPHTPDAMLDLRFLNEPYAGSKGWILHDEDGRLYHEDTGETIRFWTVNAGVAATFADVRRQARFFAKRGVNHVRWHTSVFSNGAPSFAWYDAQKVDEAQRMVVAQQESGIYTSISYFFVLGLRIQPSWGVPGYTQDWVDNNPSMADRAPFGLMFFEPMFKDAMKAWLEAVLTTPNPYDNGRPLALNPAVAIVELLNEDNLFFNTWDPAQFPAEQRNRIYEQFGDFVSARYGSIADAISAWQQQGGNASLGGDEAGNGRLVVTAAWNMGEAPGGNAAQNRRMADQIEFLGTVQRDFFAELTAFVRSLGYRGPVTGSNWNVANRDRGHLYDLEHWTYAEGAGMVDVHNYYNALNVSRSVSTRISGGDSFIPLSAINAPRRMPTVYRHIRGHPSFLSESAWTQPNDYRSEAALLTAAFGALNGLDGFTWFSSGSGTWDEGVRTWQVWMPHIGGLFPGAALLFRRGDVAEAPVVIRESKNLQRVFNRERSAMAMTAGYDPTRNSGQDFDFDPVFGDGRIDPLAFLVGRAELELGHDKANTLFVHPDLESLIDYDNRSFRSITGELELHWGEIKGRHVNGFPVEGSGWFTIDTPRSQGAVGFLGNLGEIVLSDVRVRLNNEFGSVLVSSLDGLPVAQSSRLLVQIGTRDQLTGYDDSIQAMSANGQWFDGRRIENVGTLPYQIEGADGSIVLTRAEGVVTGAYNLDTNGYLREANNNVTKTSQGYRITLPLDSLYMIVELEAPEVYKPVVTTAALATGERDVAYTFRAEAISGEGNMNWRAFGLPVGLSMNANGVISGIPAHGGLFEVTLVATDSAGNGQSRKVPFAVLPVDDEDLPSESFASWRKRFFTGPELAEPQVSGPLADPLGDGISNALKYALGLAPLEPAEIALMAPEVVEGHLTLRYRRSLTAGDATIWVEYSDALHSWSTGPAFVEETMRTTQGPWETIEVRAAGPVSDISRQFLRIRVGLNSLN